MTLGASDSASMNPEKPIKRVVRWLATNNSLAPMREKLLRVTQYGLSCQNLVVVRYDAPERAPAMNLIWKMLDTRDALMSADEVYMIYTTVQRTAKVCGDLAEVGVYRGASAKVICEAKGERGLHLFDTFEGLPTPGPLDCTFKEGQYPGSLSTVQEYLKNYENVSLYKGLFPASAGAVRDRRFSFVHLDVDLYESTRASLEFFYPRMSQGGVVLSHDYVHFPGVRKAFDEFFRDKREVVLELSGNQCAIVKNGSN